MNWNATQLDGRVVARFPLHDERVQAGNAELRARHAGIRRDILDGHEDLFGLRSRRKTTKVLAHRFGVVEADRAVQTGLGLRERQPGNHDDQRTHR